MRLKLVPAAALCAAAVWSVPALAGDVALILANERYDEAPSVSGATDLMDARDALEKAGFRVIAGEALSLEDARARVDEAAREMGDADRVVILLAGQVVHSGRDAWWLAQEASVPEGFTVGAQGLSVGALMDLAAQSRGAALVMVAAGDDPIETGLGLTAGAGSPAIPQGVTYVSGPADRLERLLTGQALRQGRSLRAALQSPDDGIGVSGYLPDVALYPDRPSQVADGGSTEEGFWNAVSQLDTVDAYLAYADRYADGRYIRQANQRIAALRAQPEQAARTQEEALNLTRENRQTIQRNLSILGYDTRGIDGIFGAGTRSAITRWQQSEGLEATGYLTRAQIATLQDAAEVRSRALEEEAARKQAEQERQDRLYWRDTAKDGGEAELRAYLKKYPDGLYADIAQARLDQIEADKRDKADAEERLTWDNVKSEDSVEAYRAYLRQYPDGNFADAAQARIDELTQTERDQFDVDAAKRDEENVAGNSMTRMLIEQRLSQLGLNPGEVDGNFDKQTRNAIRRYQDARGLAVTGYVDRPTVVRMLAGQ